VNKDGDIPMLVDFPGLFVGNKDDSFVDVGKCSAAFLGFCDVMAV